MWQEDFCGTSCVVDGFRLACSNGKGHGRNMKKVPYTPRWQGAVQGHAINTARRIYPSLCAEHEFEDLLQEAYLIYLKVKRRYPQVDTPQWFMSLFSRSLYRHFGRLADRCSRTFSLDDLDINVPEPAVYEHYIERIVLRRLPQAAVEMAQEIIFGSSAGCEHLLRDFRAQFAPRFVRSGTGRYRLMEK